MSKLFQNNVYTETNLFYSTNLDDIDTSPFQVPWYYRAEGVLGRQSTPNYYYTLKTSGISSEADIWLNGKLVVGKERQSGAYTGWEYDVTDVLRFGGEGNVFLVKVYPTNYDRDFALGFVDWNPYPPDNGTGIWRDIELKRTGQVSLSMPRITTRPALDGTIEIYLDVKNLNSTLKTSGYVDCAVFDPSGVKLNALKSTFSLSAGAQPTIHLAAKISNPQLWWPHQWGAQPLYSIQCNATTCPHKLSDSTPVTRFGLRTVASKLNKRYNNTTFFINSRRFQVLGAGYTSDMFLRFNQDKLGAQFQYVLDMGLNTIRLEGKQEHPFLYELADELGIMILAGWECCDKWEAWSYNDEGSGKLWSDADYEVAKLEMRHEAQMMQSHASMLGFLVGIDFWPADRATAIYIEALKASNWDIPIIASASQRGSPEQLGCMIGAAGFGSELGAGVGTPELSLLKRFLEPADLEDLWKAPDKGLYHMSTNARYGKPTSLEDYLLKSQMMNYEVTRSQFEAYTARWSASLARPATGMVYWMINNAWPSLHWNLYFGVRSALADLQTTVYNYQDRSIYLIDRRLTPTAPELPGRTVGIEVIGLDGKLIVKRSVDTSTELNSARRITVVPGLANITSVESVLARPSLDTLDWDNSTWYHTPVTKYSDFTAFNDMGRADFVVRVDGRKVLLENKSKMPEVFVRLNLVDGEGRDVVPVTWSENYMTLWPGEKMEIEVEYGCSWGKFRVEVCGRNMGKRVVELGGA
ncbi:hypothetical protein EJ02DRAFT_503719 [Clathrospora elynae]|uniref:Uncharacterized protein n=1 Tax=Clathrospora elynae TaxID=706981 RepID=A0A6A5SN07_9PLEO|nr:hypothetical protein EJ02DRAFT_503719 [Clathrospora elynae]